MTTTQDPDLARDALLTMERHWDPGSDGETIYLAIQRRYNTVDADIVGSGNVWTGTRWLSDDELVELVEWLRREYAC